MVLNLCSCSGNNAVDIKGAFYTENMVILVFDYADYENALPDNAENITLTLNEDVYSISLNLGSTSHNTGITTRTFDNYERYYGYAYALGYGKVEDKPQRMMAQFIVENAPDAITDAVFTLGEHTVNIKSSSFTKIDNKTEILRAEDNFEEAYQIAAFKWRMDAAYHQEEDLSIYDRVSFGPDYSYLREQMLLTFDESVNWGVNIYATPGNNYSYKGKLDEKMVSTSLPPLDLSVIKKAYPNAVEQIDKLINAQNTLANGVIDPSKSLDDFSFQGARGQLKGAYSELCKIFGMDVIIAR